MKNRKGVIILVTGLALLCLAYGLIEPYFVEVSEIDYAKSDIPKAFDGKRIVFVSDIHYGLFYTKDRVSDIAKKVNDLTPDIVVFGGDYLSSDVKSAAPCFEELAKINAPLGKFGVMGNHDHWGHVKDVLGGMAYAEITPLDNKAEWINLDGERIKLGGVGDLWCDQQDIEPTIGDVTEKDFVILLSHNPDYAENMETDNVDLVLSGHTHGGQVTFFGLWAPYTNSGLGQKYMSGLIYLGNTKVYVSRGIGTVVLPIRFFARPEITVINLKAA